MKRPIRLLLWTAAVLAALTTAPSWAVTPQRCSGKVTDLIAYRMGDLTVLADWRGDWVVVCNLSVERQGVSPAVCKSWQALIQQAMAMGRQVVFQYDDLPACNAIQTYHSAPSPNYVSLAKD